MPKIRVTPSALDDLVNIKNYIANDLSNPIAANNVVKRIVDDYSLLETTPHIGILLSTKINIETNLRFLVSGNYLIFYKTDERYVDIYRILYGRRNYLNIIFDDMGTEL